MIVTPMARVVTDRGERYPHVTGRHLERFGEKDGLVVTWQ
jgi:hypothetical protein